MTENANRIRIQGHSTIIILGGVFIAVFFCFVMSFVLLGTAFPRLFVSLLVLIFPLVLFIGAMYRAINWFEFDDDQKRVVRAFRRSFPYDKVKTIRIKEQWRRSSFSIRTGWLWKRWLVDGLNKDEAACAIQELARCFPHASIRRKTYSNGMTAAAVIIFLFLLSAAYAGFISYSYTMEPRLFLMPEKINWPAAAQPKTGVRHSMNGFRFVLPRRFTLLQDTGTSRYFEDKNSDTKLNADTGIYVRIFGQGNSAVRCLTGIEDSYDLFRLAYRERFGTVPTAMKIISFNRMRDIKLYEIERDSLRGFVLQGKKLGGAFAEIMVSDKASGNEIHFFIKRPGVLNEETLRLIVGSIKTEL